MSQVEEIDQAIKNLPAIELRRFREWFDAFDAKKWDAQIEEDTALGTLDTLADAAITEHASSNIQPR